MRLSVVIPAYESLVDVLSCLTSLQMYASRQIDIEFIVADDASPTTFFPALLPPCAAKTVRAPVNQGFAGNCNLGASFAEGDVIFFVNQDVFAMGEDINKLPFSVNWDIALAKAFDNAAVGIVGAKLVFPDGKIQSAGGLYDAHCQPFHRCLGYGDHRYWEVNTPETVSWVTGASLAIRKPLFEQVGGFDTEYVGGYFEDTALCEKVKECGASVWYEPTCRLVHRVGTSGGNPLFAQNAQRFKAAWVDTGKVKPDTHAIKANWW